MQEDFPRALTTVLVYEGGYSNDPVDPGGATMKGVTQATYNSWLARNGRPSAPVRNITSQDVANIYKLDYWGRTDCDEMPAGVDLCLFDASVNSGVGSAVSWAQAVCSITVDGDFGPKTKAAILAMDPDDFIHGFNSRRLATLKRLPTWGHFGKGWTARISNGQKIELAWAEAADGPDPVQVSTIGGHTKADPRTIPTSRVSQTAATAGTVGGALATTVSQTTSSLQPYSDTLHWVTYLLLGLTLVSAVVGGIVLLLKTWDDQASASQAQTKVDPDADAELPTVKVLPDGTVAVQAVGAGVSIAAKASQEQALAAKQAVKPAETKP